MSPQFEWHSYHLPMGTDAIIAETPTIEAKYNPRNVLVAVANDLRTNMVENFQRYVRERATG